ncbi:hypothetical protein P692DRAFT_20538032 [Suillus brevipes Sb2]|nr:hypothetical protein P692DRAFT_20538032 [Suillus brevipes Sb2]
MSSALNGHLWMLPLSELTLFTMIVIIVEPPSLARQIVFGWHYILIHIILLSLQLCPSWTGVVIAIGMAASWLIAVVLVRIPTTRRICLNNAGDLTHLCWIFCMLWVAALWYYDREPMETILDVPKKFAIYFCATLAWAVEFMVMLSFWGNLKWKRPIVMVGCLISGTLGKAFHHLNPSED